MKRPEEFASRLIGEKIKELGDWRGRTLAKVREIIHEADLKPGDRREVHRFLRIRTWGTSRPSQGFRTCAGHSARGIFWS